MSLFALAAFSRYSFHIIAAGFARTFCIQGKKADTFFSDELNFLKEILWMANFKINVFGSLEVIDPEGNQISVLGSKQQALLSYLALNSEMPLSRDRVMTLLWGDRFIEQARQSLRQSISKLRQQLVFDGRHAIWADNERLGIDPQLVNVDLISFNKLVSNNEPTTDEQAISLFRNTLLEGLFVRETAFEEWLATERVRVNESAYPVFERHVANQLKNGEQAQALETGRQLIALDRFREPSHRLQMRTLVQSGQRAAAIKQYNICANIIRAELGIEPDPETDRLLTEIKSPNASPHVPEPPAEGVDKLLLQNTQDTQQSSSHKVALSVLPFAHVGPGAEIEAFAIGLTEDITTALSKFRWLDVIAQMPIGEHDNTTATMRQNAYENGGSFSVEGSVRQLGSQLRITAQIVELSSGKYVKVNRYDQEIATLFANPDVLTETIAASIESELVAFEGEKARSLGNGNLSAWDCYHLGLATQYEFTAQGNAKAQALFRRAIKLDSSFAAAYARLSYAMVLSAIYFEADERSGLLDEALAYAQTAARLDDQDGVAMFALGRVYLARGEYEQSIVELKQAIKLNSSLAQAYCGLGDSLAYLGQAEDAIPQFEEAVRLSPQDPHRWAFSMYGALAFIFNGDYENAAIWARNSVRVPNSHYWANAALVSALGHIGKTEDTAQAVKELLTLKPDFTCSFARERMFYLRDKEQIDRYVGGLSKAGLPN